MAMNVYTTSRAPGYRPFSMCIPKTRHKSTKDLPNVLVALERKIHLQYTKPLTQL